jgi:hypothetical protein
MRDVCVRKREESEEGRGIVRTLFLGSLSLFIFSVLRVIDLLDRYLFFLSARHIHNPPSLSLRGSMFSRFTDKAMPCVPSKHLVALLFFEQDNTLESFVALTWVYRSCCTLIDLADLVGDRARQNNLDSKQGQALSCMFLPPPSFFFVVCSRPCRWIESREREQGTHVKKYRVG